MESGGKEQNYWPGFVDALSNVVLTLVFVLVIFVFALVIASNKVEQKVQEITETKDKTSSEASENQQLKQQVQQMAQQIQSLQAQAVEEQNQTAVDQQAVSIQKEKTQIQVQKQPDNPESKGAVNIAQSSNSIVVGFPLTVAEMDQKSTDRLGHVLDALTQSVGKHKILIRSYIGKETYSAAKRLAYYRAIGTRNYLITKMNESPDAITATIIQPEKPEDGRVEIVFQKQ